VNTEGPGPEARFLCLALSRRGASGAELEQLAGILDWERCLERATPFLFPCLRRALSRLPPGTLPGWVEELLASVARANAALQLQRRHELGRALSALASAGVPVIVLKGMALADLVFPDPGLRPMIDVDLLVPAADWERARAVLLDIGLRVPERWRVRPATGPASKDERDKPFERPGTAVLFELHDRLEWMREPFVYDLDAAWRSSVVARLKGDLEARVLGPEDMLLHIGMHLSSYHVFEHGLRDLLDVTLLVERHAYDWPRLAATWQRQGTAGWMRLTLDVPDALFEILPPPSDSETTVRLAVERLWSAPLDRVPPGLVTVLATRSARAGARQTAARLNPWRANEGLRAALRRTSVDLATRVPRYLAALSGGHLAPRSLRRALALRRERQALAALMSPTELPQDPPAV
jgi:hypothetical protein